MKTKKYLKFTEVQGSERFFYYICSTNNGHFLGLLLERLGAASNHHLSISYTYFLHPKLKHLSEQKVEKAIEDDKKHHIRIDYLLDYHKLYNTKVEDLEQLLKNGGVAKLKVFKNE